MEKAGLITVACLLVTACVRGPLDPVCPAVAADDLRVSEVRGGQTDLDTWGQWIELFNPTAMPIEAGGLLIRLRNQTRNGCSKPSASCDCSCNIETDESCQGFCQCVMDTDCGTSEFCQGEPGACHDFGEVTLLDSSLVVEPGGYLVAGRFPNDERPDHVDYGWETQFGSSLYDNALVELWACDGQGNDVKVHEGTWVDLPSAGTWSFDGTQWCVDDRDPAYTGDLVHGLPGTPGEANPPCN